MEGLLKRILQVIYRKVRNKDFVIPKGVGVVELVAFFMNKGLMSAIRGAVGRLGLGGCHGIFFLGRGVQISNKAKLFLGRNVYIGAYSYINCFSIGGIHLGNNVTIREFGWAQLTSNLENIGSKIVIKDNTYIGPRVCLGAAGILEIGEKCQVGANVSFVAENHRYDGEGEIFSQGTSRKGIKIGDDCWIGNNAVILDGVVLGNGVVVGAGSIVTKSFATGSVIAGVPAKLLKQRRNDG